MHALSSTQWSCCKVSEESTWFYIRMCQWHQDAQDEYEWYQIILDIKVSHLRNEVPANRLPNTLSVLKPSFCFIIKIMIDQSNHVRLGGKPAVLGRGSQVLAYDLRLNTRTLLGTMYRIAEQIKSRLLFSGLMTGAVTALSVNGNRLRITLLHPWLYLASIAVKRNTEIVSVV